MNKCSLCRCESSSVKPYTYVTYDEQEQESVVYLCNRDALYWGYK